MPRGRRSQRGLVQFTHGAFASPEHVAHIGQWYDTILKETRRPLIGESIRHFWSEPDLWRKQLNDVEERCRQGYAAYAMTSTRRTHAALDVKRFQPVRRNSGVEKSDDHAVGAAQGYYCAIRKPVTS